MNIRYNRPRIQYYEPFGGRQKIEEDVYVDIERPCSITIKCEGCNTIFTINSSVKESASFRYRFRQGDLVDWEKKRKSATQACVKQAQKQMSLRIRMSEKGGGYDSPLIGDRRCPHCGYLQSWLVAHNYGFPVIIGIIALIASIMVFVIGYGSFQSEGLPPLGVVCFSVLVLFFMVLGTMLIITFLKNPNKDWYKKRGVSSRSIAKHPPISVVIKPFSDEEIAEGIKKADQRNSTSLPLPVFEAPLSSGKICPGCGNIASTNDNFCVKCGEKLP